MTFAASQLADGARSLRHHVTDQLRSAIVTGKLKPGERLGQDQLSRDFGVSAGPVREALRHLENEGLVAYFPNRGCFVMEMTDDELVNVVLPIRLTLEQHAAKRYVAEHRPPYSSLRGIVDGMRSEPDLANLVDHDMRFHETLVVESGQLHTIQLWHGISSRVRTQLHRLGPAHGSPAEIVGEHDTLVAALETRSNRTINRALKEHILGDAITMLSRG